MRARPSRMGIGCLLWIAVLVGLPTLDEVLPYFIGVWLAWWFVGLMGVSAGLLWLRDGWQRSRILSRGLMRGKVETFVQPRSGSTGSDSGAGSGEPGTVTVLPDSGVVVSVNGKPQSDWGTVPIGEVSPFRGSAWLDHFSDAGPTDRTRDRLLEQNERDELANLIDLELRLPKILWFWIAYAAVGWTLWWSGVSSLRNEFWLLPASLGAFLSVRAILIRLRDRAKLRQDLDRGNAVVVAFGAESRSEGAPSSLEYLPASARIWTIDGFPAPWRLVALEG